MRRTIVILEDDERRRAAMRGELAALEGYTHVFFERAPDMIAWLGEKLEDCALISLDHDLVSLVKGDDPGTGMDVAIHLAERAPSCPVIVHTSNPISAPGMVYVLEQAGWRTERVSPFNDIEWVSLSWRRSVRELLA